MLQIGLNARLVLALAAVPTMAFAQTAPPSVVVVWNQAALDEVRRGRLGPPIVARALAVAHTCMYEAWVPYDPRAIAEVAAIPRRPVAEQTDTHKAKAISHAAHRCLSNLFPAGAARLDAVMRALGHEPLDTSTNLLTAAGIGNTAAAAVIAARRQDGANQYGDLRPGAYADYTFYTPGNAPMPFCLPSTVGPCALNIADPYRWQPLINNLGATQSFVAPHWGRVRPFALSSGAQFDNRPEIAAGPNYLQSPAHYQADINEILAYSRQLTAQQKLIVEYWADGPASELPPGHWSLFAQHVSKRDAHGIDQDVKMFFAMQNASFDAGIVAWHLKRKYDGVRPITGVRYFKQGLPVLAWGGPGRPIETIDGGKWSPYNPGSNLTPAFPGYVSGHSTFSAASATILRSFTGSDNFGFATTLPADFGRVEPGVPAIPTTLHYASFSAAVSQAGLSRLYAGIHFADDNTGGQLLGNLAGQLAWTKAKLLFDGGLPSAIFGTGNNVICQNLSLGAHTYNNVVVPAGARCLLTGTRLIGNLELQVGASVDTVNAVIDGNLSADRSGPVQVYDGQFNGSIQVRRGQSVVVFGTRLNGSVQLDDNIGPLWLQSLRLDGNIQLDNNRGPASLNGNVANGNLQCTGNQPAPTGAGNLAASKQGQCAGL